MMAVCIIYDGSARSVGKIMNIVGTKGVLNGEGKGHLEFYKPA